MKNKAIFIVGPTGVGKTDLSYQLAKKFNGELISADSVQVYKGLDVISGKDLPHDSKFVLLPQLSNKKIHAGYYFSNSSASIHLLDVVESTVSFNVSDYQRLANLSIKHVFLKRKLPIVVGGTGLYIKSLIDGIKTNSIEPDLEFRKKSESLDVITLQNKIQDLDYKRFDAMNESDRKNKRRLIRAIEIANQMTIGLRQKKKVEADALVIGLFCEREVLNQRIDKRVEDRLQNAALKEAKELFESYETLAQQIKDANGYKQLFQFLKGEISYDEAIYRWKISEYHHAKNQMTWFRKYGNAKWIDIEKGDFKTIAEELVSDFLTLRYVGATG